MMNSYVREDLLRGVAFQCQRLAIQVNLKSLLERQTGLHFSAYFSDRKGAYRLKMAVKDWLAMNCKAYLDLFPYQEAEMTREQVLNAITADIYRNLICAEYGEDRLIAAVNRIGYNSALRAEFFAEGDAASSRDFSYLLDQPDEC